MDFGFDNFISYPKSPEDFPQPFDDDEDLFPNGYLSTPDMNQWGSFPSDSLQTNTNSPPTSDSYTSKLPFTIIRTRPNQELKQVSVSTKLIKKKQKAKERAERKEKEVAQLLAKASKKYIPTALFDPSIDTKTKRHLVQVVKNRMAAQQSRDKRKAEVGEFDEVKRRLEDENRRLLEQNSYLMDRIKQMEENQMKILAENEQLRVNKHHQHQAIDNSFTTQSMMMDTSTSKQIVIDISDEERTQTELVCESPMGPVISRGSKKKTPFGYLFSLTTILMVFQTLTINPILPKHSPGISPSPIGPDTNPPGIPGTEPGVNTFGGPDGGPGPEPGPAPDVDPANPHGNTSLLPNTGGTGGETTDSTDPAGTGLTTENTEMTFEGPDQGGERKTDTDSGTETENGSEVKAMFKNETLDASQSGNNETDNSTNITLEAQSPADPGVPINQDGRDNGIDTSGLHDDNDVEALLLIGNGNPEDKAVNEIEKSSNTNRLLSILEASSSERSLGSGLRRPKRLLESLYDAINIEPDRRRH